MRTDRQPLRQAHRLYQAGRLPEAEACYRAVLERDPICREALEALVMIVLQDRRIGQAEGLLQRLVAAYPAQATYCDRLATLLSGQGKFDAACACYQRYLAGTPDNAVSHYNFALLLKRAGRFDEALVEYDRALQLGITRPEEVYSNISVVYSEQHREAQAEAALNRALALNPTYMPAQYNLALMWEERGDWERSSELLRRILQQAPGETRALVRLVHGQRITAPDDPLIGQLEQAQRRGDLDDLQREDLYFALGKALDDCAQYARAFEQYQHGNAFGSRRVGVYDRSAREMLTATLIDTCSEDWLESVEPVSDARLIFICGMFRSGSTLLEQILAAHPAVTAGGEINFFNQQAQRALAPFPAALPSIDPIRLRQIGSSYLDHLADTFPGAGQVTNKRPDNFVYLGLIRALFPQARILHTVRHPLDNCLSVFFQQFDRRLDYAADLLDTAHFYSQYRRLMDHWRQCFDDKILDIAYDELVSEPETTIRRALDFLGLDWHGDCLRFHSVANRVRTASAWQVRQSLYRQSSGRWQHYVAELEPLRGELEALDIDI